MEPQEWEKMISALSPSNREALEKQMEEIDDIIEELKRAGAYGGVPQHVVNFLFTLCLRLNGTGITKLKYCVYRGADVHAMDEKGRSALDLAVLRGDIEIVQFLLNCGMNVSHLDIKYFEDIIIADRLDILQLITSDIEKIKAKMFHGWERQNDLLYWAVYFRKFHIIQYLVDIGFDIHDIVDAHRGYNALHYAAHVGDPELIDFLLGLGASIYNQTLNSSSFSAFRIAVDNGHHDLAVNKLLPKEIDATDPRSQEREYYEESLLTHACFCYEESSAKMLVELGADPDKVVGGVVPLQIAIMHRRQKLIDYLYPLTDLSLIKWESYKLEVALFKCLDLDLEFADELCRATTPMIGGQPLLAYIIEAGVDINQPGFDPADTALMTACLTESPEHMQILLAQGADPNLASETHRHEGLDNMLHCAVSNAREGCECLRVLLLANPDTPHLSRIKVKRSIKMHWAILKCSDHIPKGIVIDVNRTTPMQEALWSHSGELITFCVEAGCYLYDTKALLDVVNDFIEPPLQPHIIELIEKYDASPRSLLHIAKFAVRRCLGHKDVNARIDTLDVPRSLKGFLKSVGV